MRTLIVALLGIVITVSAVNNDRRTWQEPRSHLRSTFPRVAQAESRRALEVEAFQQFELTRLRQPLPDLRSGVGFGLPLSTQNLSPQPGITTHEACFRLNGVWDDRIQGEERCVPWPFEDTSFSQQFGGRFGNNGIQSSTDPYAGCKHVSDRNDCNGRTWAYPIGGGQYICHDPTRASRCVPAE